MFVLMRFGSYLKNGRLIWHDKISPLKPPISPFETLKKKPLMFKKVGKHAIYVVLCGNGLSWKFLQVVIDFKRTANMWVNN